MLRFVAHVLLLSLSAIGAASAADVAVRFTNETGRPLVDAVVSARPFAPVQAPLAVKSATIVQRNRVFDPFVTVIQKGAAVDFPNEDSMLHHVYSFSPAKRFEIKLYKGTPPAPIVFDTLGIVTLGCNLHDWMIAYVVVVDTPFYGKSDQSGLARLVGLPAGTYDLMAWYPGLREPVRVRQLELRRDEAQQIEHRLDVAIRSRPRAPPHDPMKY